MIHSGAGLLQLRPWTRRNYRTAAPRDFKSSLVRSSAHPNAKEFSLCCFRSCSIMCSCRSICSVLNVLQVVDNGFGKFQIYFSSLHELSSCCDPRFNAQDLSSLRLRLCQACQGYLTSMRGIELMRKLPLEACSSNLGLVLNLARSKSCGATCSSQQLLTLFQVPPRNHLLMAQVRSAIKSLGLFRRKSSRQGDRPPPLGLSDPLSGAHASIHAPA